jgi:hypothetical protein
VLVCSSPLLHAARKIGLIRRYCDTVTGDWLIDYHPDFDNLVVASGDSGKSPLAFDLYYLETDRQATDSSTPPSSDERSSKSSRRTLHPNTPLGGHSRETLLLAPTIDGE